MLARYFRFFAALLLLFAGAANARDFLDWRSNEIATVAAAALPAEASETLALIHQGGP